jgi:excisionase family DNA binding protein
MDASVRSTRESTPQSSPDQRVPLLVDVDEVARLLSISRTTVFKLINSDRMVAPIRLGRALRWNFEELRAWANAGCPSRYRWEAEKTGLGSAPKRKR